jgi:putative ABC transport system ATP-binding protein
LETSWPRGLPLRLEGVRVRRGAAEVLRGLDLAFEPGRRYVIVGPSGAGKSTLLRLLNRLDDPDAGRLRIGPTPLPSLPVRAVRTGVGLVFQAPRPLPGTVRENLLYPFEVRGRRPTADGALAGALEEVGLDPLWLDRDAQGLSGGERQRLALAVALGAGPEFLALDEPTAALDPVAARRVADLLALRSRRDGLRTIAVTHHREHAAWLGETAVVLDDGRLADLGPTAEVLARADAGLWHGSASNGKGESA